MSQSRFPVFQTMCTLRCYQPADLPGRLRRRFVAEYGNTQPRIIRAGADSYLAVRELWGYAQAWTLMEDELLPATTLEPGSGSVLDLLLEPVPSVDTEWYLNQLELGNLSPCPRARRG